MKPCRPSFRLVPFFGLLLAGLLQPLSATGQHPYASAAPPSLGLQMHAFPDHEAFEVLLTAARRVPVTLFLPEVATDSHVDLLFGAAGVRLARDRRARLRWRAGLLDLNLYRPPLAIGFTLLDANRTGRTDLHARWLGLRLGPSLRLGGSGVALEPRLVGVAALSTLRLGSALYAPLGPASRNARTNLELGYRLQGILHLGPRLSVAGVLELHRHYGGSQPTLHTRRLEARFAPETRIDFTATLGHERTRLADRSTTFPFFQVTFRYLFAPGGL
ncbi:MAG: hypothetical protein KatS3mg044_0737 [Rhodothermaceae bacterium]|nr:MAG: hypothetical protein KatS3mg044_0737 [Rhodothermaceae bacterium]